MPKKYAPLPTTQLAENNTYCHRPELTYVAHVDDPASVAMTDFITQPPLTIHPDDLLPLAHAEMQAGKVHGLLVINKDDHVVGLVTAEHIIGDRAIKVAQEMQLPHDEIKVRAVMTPISNITVLQLEDVNKAHIGNIASTLVENESRYALVIEQQNDQQKIRGIFSARKIGEMLGCNITDIVSKAHSLAELQKKLS